MPTIWGTTLLHLVSSADYPIYDQHVHRAYSYMQSGIISEIPRRNIDKYVSYYNDYVPFFNEVYASVPELKKKQLDNALWAFGRFLSLYPKVLDIRSQLSN